MSDQQPDTSEASLLRAQALSSWENEGGAAEVSGRQKVLYQAMINPLFLSRQKPSWYIRVRG